ncbi:MAG: trimeric intracellular cation channel family protein [Clostridiales bacterium]|nr:trimeric intracellular cation channel family protein [Clostridiales bacterium]
MHQFTQLIELIELVGTIAFAISGAMTGLRKGMDMFGVCMLGITAATCGGIIRDIMMGVTPPYIFTNPRFFVTSLITSLIVFSPRVRYHLFSNRKRYDMTLLITDSAGLGLFTYYGVEAAINAGFISNPFLVVTAAVITGVGGGMLRDILAGDRPYIFVKHIYACAVLIGAIVCYLIWNVVSQTACIFITSALVFAIRMFSAYYHWSLPKARDLDNL